MSKEAEILRLLDGLREWCLVPVEFEDVMTDEECVAAGFPKLLFQGETVRCDLGVMLWVKLVLLTSIWVARRPTGLSSWNILVRHSKPFAVRLVLERFRWKL